MSSYRLVYVSRAREDLSMEDMEAILKTARAFNSAHDVTGALFFNGSSFLQVLEGGVTDLDEIYERVLEDDRHTDLRKLEEVKSDVRVFPDWAMHLIYTPPAGASGTGWDESLRSHRRPLPDAAPPTLRRMIENFEAMSL